MEPDEGPTSRPALVGCIAQGRRRRFELALKGIATIEWHESFAQMGDALARSGTATVALVSATDAAGFSAGPFVSSVAANAPLTPIVLYATQVEILSGALASPVFTDLIVADETDGKIFVQSIVLKAMLRMTAERVVAALRPRLSPQLATFVECAVRNPSCGSVEALAARLGVHRQTTSIWCRKDRHLRPEELLMWSRVLLASAMLEVTDRSVASLTLDLEFPSTVALRNQLKRYTGLTATEVRAAGFGAILARFDKAVESARVRQIRSIGGDGAESGREALTARF